VNAANPRQSRLTVKGEVNMDIKARYNELYNIVLEEHRKVSLD